MHIKLYPFCINIKLLSRLSFEVLTKMSTGRVIIKFLYTCPKLILSGLFSSFVAFYIAELISSILSQAKHKFTVIFVLFLVFYWTFFKHQATSFLNRSTLPIIWTWTFFLRTNQLSSESQSKVLSTSSMSLLTQIYERLKFSIEKQKKEAYFTPSSRQQSRQVLRLSLPSSWPLQVYLFLLMAYRRFPSMIKLICSGMWPCLSMLMRNFSVQLSSSIGFRNQVQVQGMFFTKIIRIDN